MDKMNAAQAVRSEQKMSHIDHAAYLSHLWDDVWQKLLQGGYLLLHLSRSNAQLRCCYFLQTFGMQRLETEGPGSFLMPQLAPGHSMSSKHVPCICRLHNMLSFNEDRQQSSTYLYVETCMTAWIAVRTRCGCIQILCLWSQRSCVDA